MHGGVDPTAKAMLALALIVLGSFVFGAITRRFGQPHVVGVLLFGVLASTLFNALSLKSQTTLLPASSGSFIHVTGQVGLVLLVFVIGNHLRTESSRPKMGKLAATAGLGFLIPLVVGSAAALSVLDVLRPKGTNSAETTIFLGLALAVTAVPVLVFVLDDLGARESSTGLTAMTIAVMNDGLVWAAVVVLGVIRGSSGLSFDSTVLGLAILALVLVVLPALMHWLSDASRSRLLEVGSGLPLVVAVAVAAGAASSMVGLHPIVGALAAGLTFPRGPDTTDALDHVGRIATSVLAPVFFVDSCRSAPLQLFGHLPASELARLPIVLAAAIIGKLLAGQVAGRIDGLNRTDRTGLGILLNCRGVTEIAVAAAGEATGLITPTAFLLLYLVALTTTALTAPAWRRFVEPSTA